MIKAEHRILINKQRATESPRHCSRTFLLLVLLTFRFLLLHFHAILFRVSRPLFSLNRRREGSKTKTTSSGSIRSVILRPAAGESVVFRFAEVMLAFVDDVELVLVVDFIEVFVMVRAKSAKLRSVPVRGLLTAFYQSSQSS